MDHVFTICWRPVDLELSIDLLLVETCQLRKTVKKQSSLLEEIEKKYPGISDIKIEEDGTILLEDEDFSDALKTLHVEEEDDFGKAK